MQTNLSDLSEGRKLPEPVRARSSSKEQLQYREDVQISESPRAVLSESVYAVRLSLYDVQPQDVLWLDKALAGDYHEVTSADILQGFVDGRFDLWRLPEGIAVTTIQVYPAGKELHCAYLAGVNHLTHLSSFVRDMDRYAKEKGCRWFLCASQHPALDRLYGKFGKEVGKIFTREIV